MGNTNKLFNFSVGYNQGPNPLYNGNISQTQWRTANSDDSSLKSYLYTYDALNRITQATDNTGYFNLGSSTNPVIYDKNGNILKLKREGWTVASPSLATSTGFGTMDDLMYSYAPNSNKLMKVADAAAIDQFGFKDDAVNTTLDNTDDYGYDLNGNMTSDLNKGIAANGIEYNHLNMPTKITVSSAGANNGVIDYVYAADRTKIQKRTTQGNNVTTTDYNGNYVYENGNLKQITQPEGYIEPDGSNWQYVYRYADIWGNTRITYVDDNGDGSVDSSEIRREQNYYPFGMEHKGYNSGSYGVENNLKTYQGQEFTNDLGLNTHEWKYRVSDPATGRFWQIDPLAEKYTYNSTYAFQENKLGIGIELEGLEVVGFGTIRPNQGPATPPTSLGLSPSQVESVLDEVPIVGESISLLRGDFVGAGLSIIPGGKKLRTFFKKIKSSFKKGAKKADDVTEIVIDANKHPESAKHLNEAIEAGKSNEGVIDRAGAANRRKENLKGTKTQKGKDRDEAPPAVVDTGESASVKHISSSDNRGSGGSIGQQIKDLPDGTKVKVVTKNN